MDAAEERRERSAGAAAETALGWSLLGGSLALLAAGAIQAGSLTINSNTTGLCGKGQLTEGTRVEITINQQHWIWVKCARAGT